MLLKNGRAASGSPRSALAAMTHFLHSALMGCEGQYDVNRARRFAHVPFIDFTSLPRTFLRIGHCRDRPWPFAKRQPWTFRVHAYCARLGAEILQYRVRRPKSLDDTIKPRSRLTPRRPPLQLSTVPSG